MANRSVMVTLRAEIGQYKAAMTEASKATKGVSEEGAKASAEGKAFVDNWSKASGPLLAVGGAITALGVSVLKTGISYNQLQQQSRAALTTILGSAEAANAQMDKLDEFARTSPFSKSTFISAQQQMLAFGIEAQKVIPYLDAIQDAVAASGGGNADIAGVVATMSKVQSSAKLTAEDLNELGNRGINAAELIGSQMGKTGAQIREEITAGTLGADVALDALAAGMEQRFDGAADNVKNTFTGALDRISAAWRDLSSDMAEPFVGKEGGGIFTALLNEGADFLRLVGELPGPVKATVGGVTLLAGAGMLAAGAFLALAPRIVATRAALATMAADGSRAAVGLQRTGTAAASAGKAAGKFVAAAASLGLVVNAFSDSSTEGVNQWTEAILNGKEAVNALAEGNVDDWFFGMGKDGLAGSIQDADQATSGFNKTLGIFGLNMRERGANEVKAFDQALAALVADGKLDEAAEGAEMFAEAAEKGGVKSDKAQKMLGAYNDALASNRMESKDAAAGSAGFAAAQEKAAEAHKKAREAAIEQGNAFVGLGESVADAEMSLGDWIGTMEKQSAALRNFTDNAIQAANKGLRQGLIAELREAGPEGALRMSQLADASEKEIDRANKAWGGGRRAVGDYVAYVAMVSGARPEVITKFKTAGAPGAIKTAFEVAEAADLNKREVRTILEALDYASDDIDAVLKLMNKADGKRARVRIEAQDTASAAIAAAQRALRALDGDYATTYIRTQRGPGPKPGPTEAGANGGLWSGGARKFADGGFDEFGRPVSRVPQIRSGSQGTVMWGEPETGWEAYVSGKPSQKPRNRAILSEAASRLGGNVEWFADGGFTEAVTAREFTSLRIRVRDLQRALKETEKTKRGRRPVLRGLDRLEARQELREAKAELAEQNRIRRTMKRHGHKTSGSYNRAMQRQADARDAAVDARENRQSVASNFSDGLDGDAFKSPASLERALANMLRDGAEHTQLLADLRKAGASPWLLEQLVKAGPSRATNRTARALLADTARLKRLNAMSGGIVSVGNQYAALTTGSGFTASYSGAAGFDYNALARAMAQIQIIAPVTPRTAAQITQAGTKFAEVHA